MNKVLEDYLLKTKIDPKEMTAEEKATFDKWSVILSGEVTVQKIVEFCDRQKEVIENQWASVDNDERKNERLIIYHTIYSKIIKMIQADETERVALANHLQSLIDNAGV